MPRVWYYLLRTYVRLGLFFFYRKMIVRGVDHLPQGPILFAPNHQNAFMDALLVVCTNHRFTHFLARADIFKKRLVRGLLSTLNLLPVYRLRDGFENLPRNQQTFDTTSKLFARGHSLILFPEGNHGAQRRVRPLSKGFTRLVFDFLRKHPTQTLHIVPVGLNYEAHRQFRSAVSIWYGRPIAVTAEALLNETAEAQRLRLQVSEALKKLTTHIEDSARHDALVWQLERAGATHLYPAHSQALIDRILRGERLPEVPLAKRKINFLWRWLHTPVLAVWRRQRAGIQDPVFVASLKFAFGLFVFPLYYLAVGSALMWAVNGWVAAGVCACLVVSTLVTVRATP
ncbi:MAG: 1-acyl-sn-glycerol-3-phosphate acyltransferase [Cyclobacteriaceae bacterium]|jgi:1-acyl-sn-glycerol-3-phosphate acyltransferase|nr:1-acyl-sn-glycerol-3-phosphate acyltransferase [Cyclobacteriaceae bacterium]